MSSQFLHYKTWISWPIIHIFHKTISITIWSKMILKSNGTLCLDFRKETHSSHPSPSGSSVSSLTVPVKADDVTTDGTKTEANNVRCVKMGMVSKKFSFFLFWLFLSPQAVEVKPVSPSPELDVDRIFKKSVKRHAPPGQYLILTLAVFLLQNQMKNIMCMHVLVFIPRACIDNGPAWWAWQARSLNGQQESVCTWIRHTGKQFTQKNPAKWCGSFSSLCDLLNVTVKTKALPS